MENKNKREEIDKYTIPQCVSVTLDSEKETVEQRVERQGKFLQLPENIKDKLVSYQTSGKIRRIGNHYKLKMAQLAPIARIIRSYYFGEVKLAEFPDVLSQEIGIDLTKAQEISHFVIEKIIKQEVEVIKASDSFVKMPIRQALEKYSGLKYQLIGSGSIDLDGKPYPIKMTIENWIKDYHSVIGGGNKDSLKRGEYLYKSRNTKKLNSAERNKIAFLIKMMDENGVVSIDADNQKIIFKEQISTNKTKINKTEKKTSVDIIEKNIPSQISRQQVSDNHSSNSRKSIKDLRGVSIKDFIANDVKTVESPEIENNLTMKGNSMETVNSQQGGNWDLHSQMHKKESDNPLQKENKGRNLMSKLLGRKSAEASVDEDDLQFSSSQKLPQDSI